MRRLSTAAVLFHHALAARLGLGPTDLKCYDLLRDRGAMTGSQLAALSGLTTGAVTGVVNRLERAGFVDRRADPADGRKQILSPLAHGAHGIHGLFRQLHGELFATLDAYDVRQVTTISDFLKDATELLYRQAARLRVDHIATDDVAARPPRSHRSQSRRAK